MMWLDIAEAPKNGDKILLWTEYEGDEICPPFGEAQIGYWDSGNLTGDMWHRESGWVCSNMGTPTHWMRLPLSPFRDGATLN